MQHGSFVHALLLAALALPLAAAQPWQQCGSSGNYSANSTYQANLNQLATTLPRNAASSGGLFASGAVGTTPETAYALTLCRGDTNASACFTCVTTIFQDAQQLCPYNKEVSIVGDLCYLRFSNLNFLASTDNSGVVDLYNTWNFSGDVGRYDRSVTGLLNATAYGAAYAAGDSTSRFATGEMAGFDELSPNIYSTRRFATGEMAGFTGLLNATAPYAGGNSTRPFVTGEKVGFNALSPKVYSMAQCTPDLSQAQCRRCLDDLVGRWWQTFVPNTQGARSVGTRCNMRFEMYSFYSAPRCCTSSQPLRWAAQENSDARNVDKLSPCAKHLH